MTFHCSSFLSERCNPWTTPPTSWPTPPQSATPSSTWPTQPPPIASAPRPPMTWPTTTPSSSSTPHPGYLIDPHQYSINPPQMPGTTPTPVEHLFGQPSALHPTWSSSTSFLPTASTTPPPSFASLATAPHAVPAPHLVPTTTTPLGSDTTTLHTAPPAFATPTAPTFPITWPTASDYIPSTDYTTYTSTRLTLPTSCSSISTSGYYDIDSSSSCTSIHGSQSSPKGSIREET